MMTHNTECTWSICHTWYTHQLRENQLITDNWITIFYLLPQTTGLFIYTLYIATFYMHVRTLIFSQFLLHLKIIGRPVWILCDISILTGALFTKYFKALKLTLPLKKICSMFFCLFTNIRSNCCKWFPIHTSTFIFIKNKIKHVKFQTNRRTSNIFFQR